MFIAAAIFKGLTGAGWICLFAVDFHVVRVRLSDLTHGDIRGVLVAMTIGIIAAHWKRRGGGRTYSEGVVDGMRLTASGADLPTPRREHDTNVLYLDNARCTQRAPKVAPIRSS